MINSNNNNINDDDNESKTSSTLLINNETNKNNNLKTKSIESYEKRFLNSLKQLNAPEWYSMNVSSTSSLKCLNSNKKYDSSYTSTNNNNNTNNLTTKSITDSTTTSQALLNSHKQKYDRIRQRYRSQQRQSSKEQATTTTTTNNDTNNLITPQKRDLSLNKSTRSLGYNIRQSYIDSNEQVDEKENIKNTNNNNILINYSKSAYSLNNNDLLLNLNNNDLMKRSQSGYNNNRSNNSIISNDDPALVSTVTGQANGSSKSRPLWLSHSALQNKSSSTINSFTSNCSNWYKPKNLQLPPHLLNSTPQDKQETTTNG